MPSLYDRPDMQHLTQSSQAQAVLAWHTGLDIQAIRSATGQAMLVIRGQHINHAQPEMAVAYLASQSTRRACALMLFHYGVSL